MIGTRMIARRAGFPEHEAALDVSFLVEQFGVSPLKLSR